MIRKKYDECINYRISQCNLRYIRSKAMEEGHHQYREGYVQGLNIIRLVGNPGYIFDKKRRQGDR